SCGPRDATGSTCAGRSTRRAGWPALRRERSTCAARSRTPCLQRAEAGAERVRNPYRPARGALDEDMDEVAERAKLVAAEDADLVADAAGAEAAHPQAGVDRLRKRDLAQVAAAGLDADADHLSVDVEAVVDQPPVDHGVEVRVVDDVVDVAVDVVVVPAGLDRAEVREVLPRVGRRRRLH